MRKTKMYIEYITVDELVQALNVCWCGRISMRNVRLQRSDSLTRKAQGLSQRWTSETSWLLSRVICLPRKSMTILLRSVGIIFFFTFSLPHSSVLNQAYPSSSSFYHLCDFLFQPIRPVLMSYCRIPYS